MEIQLIIKVRFAKSPKPIFN